MRLAGVPTEIERKFLVRDLRGAGDLGPGRRLEQGYLARDGDVEVRVRRVEGGPAVMTVKAGSGLRRVEVEVDVGPDEVEALWPSTRGRRLAKVRHEVDLGGRVAEVDRYEGPLAGLVTVEVEFPDADAAAAFTPPAWFGREVTGDAAWGNAALAVHGRPADAADAAGPA